MNCKVCNSSDAPEAFRLSNFLSVLRCQRCGFTFVDHVAVEDDLPSSGHDEAGVLDADEFYCRKFPGRLQLIERLSGRMSGKSTLDVGAGGGGWLEVAHAAGAVVAGIEFCESCRQYAATKRSLTLDANPLEHEHWVQRRGSFDSVTAWDVLEHVNHPLQFLESCVAMLKPEGILAISTPVRDTPFDRIGEAAYRLTGGSIQFLLAQRYSRVHLQIFHSAQLQQLALKCGLEELYYSKVQELSFPPERYFRNIYGNSSLPHFAGKLCGAVVCAVRIPNKVIGVFRKELSRT